MTAAAWISGSTHKRIECSCGVVIMQCRCPGPKKVEIRPHPACESAHG